MTRLRLLIPFVLLALACATTPSPAPAPPASAVPQLTAGFRYSVYGPDFNPGPAYWGDVGQQMVERFPGSKGVAVWIVSRLSGQGTELSFPGPNDDPLIQYTATDANEESLDLFDRQGFDCWLQVEPGNAPVDTLLDVVLTRYKHHPCVVGAGIDVEWLRSVKEPEGDAVTDEEARRWVALVRKHNPEYRLFLKHWLREKMPPTYRDGLLFIDDSQIFPSFQAMVDEFEQWGKAFAPSPVGFQYGYPSDRPWWMKLEDPAREIGEAIQRVVPNLEGLYWVDFTVLDIFPPPPELVPPHLRASPEKPVVGVKIYDRPADLADLFAKWGQLGVTTAFASETLAGDREFRQMASQRGIDVYVIAPVFQNPDAIAAEPGLRAVTSTGAPAKDDWVDFVCPSRASYRERRVREILEMVRRLEPQGLSIDFIRHFVFWEKVAPGTAHTDIPNACFCDSCVKSFSAENGISVPSELKETPAIAAWILENHSSEWTDWKIALIDSMAASIASAAREVDPGIRINIHAVPWRRTDFGGAIVRSAGQQFETLSKHADTLSPMAYSHMQQRMPQWIHSVVVRLGEQSSAPILPSIQVAEAYRPGVPFPPGEFEQAVLEALRVPSRGVVFWSWEALAANPEKFRIAVEAVRNRVSAE